VGEVKIVTYIEPPLSAKTMHQPPLQNRDGRQPAALFAPKVSGFNKTHDNCSSNSNTHLRARVFLSSPLLLRRDSLSLYDFVRRRLIDERQTTKRTVVGETKRQDSNNTEDKPPSHNLERELQFYSTACSCSRLLTLDTLKHRSI